jgi:hypothetical protein
VCASGRQCVWLSGLVCSGLSGRGGGLASRRRLKRPWCGIARARALGRGRASGSGTGPNRPRPAGASTCSPQRCAALSAARGAVLIRPPRTRSDSPGRTQSARFQSRYVRCRLSSRRLGQTDGPFFLAPLACVPQPEVEPSTVLGVFGLSLRTDEAKLREVFAKFGKLDKCTLVMDRQVRSWRSCRCSSVAVADSRQPCADGPIALFWVCHVRQPGGRHRRTQ